MTRTIGAIALALLLAACANEEPINQEELANSANVAATVDPEPAPANIIGPDRGDPSLPDTGAEHCIAELARVANVDAAKIRVATVDPTGGPVIYTMDLEGAEQPWQCTTDPAARVTELMYMGEG
ncbi:hypothetical protein [Sphingomicrobium flavum]|uniref:hypothetical protein n=1 Tax=Sphingomicrobium flavum TaxID=1229164 RepID=UPI0021ADB545|nr:hypothetical protein [Sphingomicrobium flavum]